MRVVATAGHVDHGKSSLVLALTGTDPDRFAEEKQRGLTIDLGFAFTPLPSGETLAFVDVPGHVRFLKNMLAGVGAVEAAMFVVAANEGWMPQSEEHLRILELLGVHDAIAVLTKSSLVDADTLELARLELDDRLQHSALAGAPVVTCDSKTGAGLDDVRTALDVLVQHAPMARDRGRPRLWVDRVFAAKGAGTIVTGTLAGGALAVDDELLVLPSRTRVRVRGLESHHEKVARVGPGSRVAVNVTGVEHHDVGRGDVLVRAGQWWETRTVDTALTMLPDVDAPKRGAFKAYIGSGEHDVRVRVLDDRFARIHLTQPLPLAPGDRIVLRETGRQQTVGGAEVLDVAPVGRAALAPDRLGLALGARILAGRPWVRSADFAALAGVLPTEVADLTGDATRLGDWIVAGDELARVRKRALEIVRRFHQESPREPGIDLTALAAAIGGVDGNRGRAALADDPSIVIEHGRARLPSHRTGVDEDPQATALLDALRAQPFAPPALSDFGAPPDLVRALLRANAIVDLDGVVFAADAVVTAREKVVAFIAEHGSMTVAQARDVLGSSRRYVLALLTRFDADGVTRRRGDERILGPRGEAAVGSVSDAQ